VTTAILCCVIRKLLAGGGAVYIMCIPPFTEMLAPVM
jgi:hypothetical protein